MFHWMAFPSSLVETAGEVTESAASQTWHYFGFGMASYTGSYIHSADGGVLALHGSVFPLFLVFSSPFFYY